MGSFGDNNLPKGQHPALAWVRKHNDEWAQYAIWRDCYAALRHLEKFVAALTEQKSLLERRLAEIEQKLGPEFLAAWDIGPEKRERDVVLDAICAEHYRRRTEDNPPDNNLPP